MNLDFTNINLPFTAGELVTVGDGLLLLVGGLILLRLAFIIVPMLINMIRKAFNPHYGEQEIRVHRDEKGTLRDQFGNRER